jgi:hypothetical protein
MRFSVKSEQTDEAQNEEKEQKCQEFPLLAGEFEKHRSAIFGYGSVTSQGLRLPNKPPFFRNIVSADPSQASVLSEKYCNPAGLVLL